MESSSLGSILDQAPKPQAFGSPSTRIAKQLRNVASVIMARNSTDNEREVFYVEAGGFDSHFTALRPGTTTYDRMNDVNVALGQFETQMKNESIWDDVIIVSASDFGRKLVGNGGGSDHAWGGHGFIAGGAVRGGQILGSYPSRLDNSHVQNILNSNGRFIPTVSLEAVWKSAAEWFGVRPDQIEHVLPNLANFPPSHAFRREDVFQT